MLLPWVLILHILSTSRHVLLRLLLRCGLLIPKSTGVFLRSVGSTSTGPRRKPRATGIRNGDPKMPSRGTLGVRIGLASSPMYVLSFYWKNDIELHNCRRALPLMFCFTSFLPEKKWRLRWKIERDMPPMDRNRLPEVDEDIIHRVRVLEFGNGTDSIPDFRSCEGWMENVDQSEQPGHSRKRKQTKKIPHFPQIPQQTVVHQDQDRDQGDCWFEEKRRLELRHHQKLDPLSVTVLVDKCTANTRLCSLLNTQPQKAFWNIQRAYYLTYLM